MDGEQLRRGLPYWRPRSDVVVGEGAGGLMTPVTGEEYVADLALDFPYPLLVVAANSLGVINQALQTLITAATFRKDYPWPASYSTTPVPTPMRTVTPVDALNRPELAARCVHPVLAPHASQAEASTGMSIAFPGRINTNVSERRDQTPTCAHGRRKEADYSTTRG